MATYRVVDEYPVQPDDATHVVASVAEALRCRLVPLKEPGSYAVKFSKLKWAGNTTELLVKVCPAPGGCSIEYRGKLFGVGPVVGKKVRATVEELRQSVLANLSQSLRLAADAAIVQGNVASRSSADALRELQSLLESQLITEEEFAAKREEIIDRL